MEPGNRRVARYQQSAPNQRSNMAQSYFQLIDFVGAHVVSLSVIGFLVSIQKNERFSDIFHNLPREPYCKPAPQKQSVSESQENAPLHQPKVMKVRMWLRVADSDDREC